MIAIAHFLAISCYIGAAGLASAPFARPIPAPVRGVVAALALGVAVHAAALIDFAVQHGQLPFSGMGPALSFAGFLVAATLLLVEVLAREVSLTLFAAPLAALATIFALLAGLVPWHEPSGTRGIWLASHIAFSFIGMAAFATAAAAGTMYLVERRELKSRRFGAIFQFFPPLDTLDRVNHAAAVAGWLALTVGVALAVSYSVAYSAVSVPNIVWGLTAWAAVTALTFGRLLGGWQARRTAVLSSTLFVGVMVLYIAIRMLSAQPGRFL
ncbi:MAG TPA: cytochrome c biogenesis protein CcsA [Gemmatimonadaceae bacterium]|nr:cytochrome c biogenesis protein CcsA [Gemmatimonadaceae bacterium]